MTLNAKNQKRLLIAVAVGVVILMIVNWNAIKEKAKSYTPANGETETA